MKNTILWRFIIRKAILESFFILIGLPLIIFLRLIRPMIRVRFGRLVGGRIGFLLGGAEPWLRRQSLRKKDPREINIFFSGPPANRQALEMLKRRIKVVDNKILVTLHDYVKRRIERTPFIKDMPLWIDLDHRHFILSKLWNEVVPQLNFTEEEHKRGEQILASMNIPPGKPYVCFSTRDKTYLDTAYRDYTNWGYHDYRNANIENSMSAIKFLAEQGIYALRIGKAVERPIEPCNPRIIDYATKFRSDFADMYLMAHCKFFLGDTSGIFLMAVVFGVPCAYANMVPIALAPARGAKSIFILKKYWHIESKRLLTFREILARGADNWHDGRKYKHAGIEVIENTPDEILGLAREMNSRLDNTWNPSEEDEELQCRYRMLFPPGHRCHGFPSRVGAEFLRQNGELLE